MPFSLRLEWIMQLPLYVEWILDLHVEWIMPLPLHVEWYIYLIARQARE